MREALALWAAATLLAGAASGSIPLFFEHNKGQTDERVDFLSRGGGYVLFLTDGEAVLKLKDRAVRMRLPGARRDLRAVGEDAMPGRSNYLRGGDGSRDVTGVAQYSKVRYDGVYPGIDLVYYGKDGKLEYDFLVAPGADPSRIRMRFDGARDLRLDKDGNLLVDEGVRFDKPVLYQEDGDQRVNVAGAFRLRGRDVTFDVGSYRRDLPLVIDPVLSYSTYLGGSSGEYIAGVGVDAAGNAYVGGMTMSADFPVTAGAHDTMLGNSDWFVAKLNPSGSALVYATFIGPEDNSETLADLGVTNDGRVVAVGSYMPATAGSYSSTSCCGAAVRLNTSGTGLEYVAQIGFSPTAVSVLSDGGVVVVGNVPVDAPTTPGAYQRIRQGQDGYILKLNASGSAPVFATYLGGPAHDSILDVGVDPAGNVYVVGTADQGFPTTPGAYQVTGSGFAAKVVADGSSLAYSTLVQGVVTHGRQRLAVGAGGDLWVTGFAESGFLTTPGSYLSFPTPYGASGFLLRLNTTATSAVFSTYINSTWMPSGVYDIVVAVDASGEGFVASTLSGPTTPNAFQTAEGGLYIQRFNASGSILQYATYHGGTAGAIPGGLALDSAGNLYVAGTTTATNMPTTPGALQNTNRGGSDGFIAKIDNANISCSYTLTSATTSITAGATTGTVGVTANSGCSWVATTSDTWITISSGASGIGSGTLHYSVEANRNTQPRTGTITIAGKSFIISQTGATCTYSIAPTSLNFDLGGGIANVAVTAPQGCSWTVISNAVWITTGVITGNGDGNVQYGVAPHTGAPRTGTMTIAGQTFTVTQCGTTGGCTFNLSPSAQNAPLNGGTYAFTVNTTTGCQWTATSSQPWIVITSGASGAGSGAVQFTVEPNSGAARQGVITAGGRTFTITQSGAGACTYSLSTSAISAPAGYLTGTVTLTTTDSTCPWTASSNSNWAQIFPGEGSGTGTIHYTVFPNFTAAMRTAILTLGGQQFTIMQGAGTGTPDERFVGSMYFGAFGRIASPAEVAGHVKSGRSRPELVDSFLKSKEFLDGAKFVAGLYVGILGRDAEYGGWLFQRNAMARSGMTPHALVANFLNSLEFKLQHPTLPDAEFVRLMYRQVLGRQPSQAEVDFQVTHMPSRVQLAVLFLTSEEYQKRVGDRLTGFLLHALLYQRGPTPEEFNLRGQQIGAGTPLTTIIAEMLAQQPQQ